MSLFRYATIILISFSFKASALEVVVYFKDKGINTLAAPHQFLSQKSLDRKIMNHVEPDILDIAVDQTYINILSANGFEIKGSSKWLNAVYISNVEASDLDKLNHFSFVGQTVILKQTKSNIASVGKTQNRYPCESFELPQRDMLEVEQMHYNGYIGTDVLICVMDDGFKNVHQIDGFKHLYNNKKIISTKNFLTNDDDIYFVGGHGTAVLSNIAGYIPGKLHGTGYGASFLLARTEIDSIESPLEMFHWARAAEWADSIGADILSTSLGYTQFDDPVNDFYYADMDGKTTLISQAAAIAVSKGMLVVNSAGNEGSNSWRYISAPADVEGVVTVGAVDANENIANFSSRGPTWDGRIKPDLCCQGVSNVSISTSGTIYYPSGTSFSCPTFSGFAACLMQLMKNTPVEQIKQMIYSYCTMSASPNNDYGRGVPKAKEIYKQYTGKDLQPLSSCDNLNKEGIYIYPIPTVDNIYIMFDNRKNLDHIYVQLFDMTGKVIQNYTFNAQPGLQQIAINPINENISNGMYYIFIYDNNGNVLTEQKIIFL